MIVRARFKPAKSVPVEAVSAEARMLALAYAVNEAVENGRYASVADVARAFGVSRARMSQVLRRRWAMVEDQERALMPGFGGQQARAWGPASRLGSSRRSS